MIQARTLARERLGVLKSKTSVGELRGRSRDLPPPRRLSVLTPLPPAPAPLGAGEASPFSLEALILAEVAAARPRPRARVIWELARPGTPRRAPARLDPARPPIAAWAGARLDRRVGAYLVWTEPALFGADDDELRGARAYLDGIPERVWAEEIRKVDGPFPPAEVGLLRADLILEPWQLYQTHVLGGDGVTLFVDALSDEQLEELIGYCQEVGLGAACVVADGRGVARALARGGRTLLLAGDPFRKRGAASPVERTRDASAGGAEAVAVWAHKVEAAQLTTWADAGARAVVARAGVPALLDALAAAER